MPGNAGNLWLSNLNAGNCCDWDKEEKLADMKVKATSNLAGEF